MSNFRNPELSAQHASFINTANFNRLKKLGLLAATGYLIANAGVVGAQETAPTPDPNEHFSTVTVGSPNLRAEADLQSADIGDIGSGVAVEISRAGTNDGYEWARVWSIGGEPVTQETYVAIRSVDGRNVYLSPNFTPVNAESSSDEVQETVEAIAVPEAPVIGTEAAPTLIETEAAPASVEAIINQAEDAMRLIGVENPVFSGPILHDDLQTFHLDRSTYYLGQFNTTNGDYLVSYCAPVAVATQAAYSATTEPLAVATGLVDQYQYNTSGQVMENLGSADEANIDIAGVNYHIKRWEMTDEGIEDQLEALPVGGSVVIVFRDVEDTSKVGHLITVQRNGPTTFTITQSNTVQGMFFNDPANTTEANNMGAGNGGVYVSVGNAETVSNFVNRIATWFYSTGMVGMYPQA